MDIANLQIILASGSPSRKLLFDRAGVLCTVDVSGADETTPEGATPAQIVEALAVKKADAVTPRWSSAAVIAADSVVSIDGVILGKPRDEAHAAEILERLSGRIHEIYTGVCISYCGKREVFHQVTKVEFYPLSVSDIDDYIKTGEPMGKAGAYGLEGKGVLLIKGIIGDYTNVIGLPMAETLRRLKSLSQTETQPNLR